MGDVPFEAAQDFAVCLAFGAAPGCVGLGSGVRPRQQALDGDPRARLTHTEGRPLSSWTAYKLIVSDGAGLKCREFARTDRN